MKREEIPLISGRKKVVDVCRNCGWKTTEIYTARGAMILWRNEGKPSPAVVGGQFGSV